MGRGRFAANADVVVAAEALSAYTAAVDTAAGKVGLSGFTRLNGAFYRQQRTNSPLGAWDPEQKWDLWLCGMVLLSAALQQWALSDICSKKELARGCTALHRRRAASRLCSALSEAQGGSAASAARRARALEVHVLRLLPT